MQQTPLHQPLDLEIIPGGQPPAAPFEVVAEGRFRHLDTGRELAVPGFYAGDGRWIVRFRPTHPGRWSAVLSLDGEAYPLPDRGSEFACAPNPNPAVHGQVGIDPGNPRRLSWSDNTPCTVLGFECDWLFSFHQRHPEECARRLAQLRDRGFTYVVMNVYAHTGFSLDAPRPGERPAPPEHVYGPPDLFPFGGSNAHPDHEVLNPAFFDDYDRLLTTMHSLGLVAHIMIQVQNKQVHWPERRSAADDRFWQYVVARYQAFGNVVWDVGKESFHLERETGTQAYVLERIALIRDTDAYAHLVTVHDPCLNLCGAPCGDADGLVDAACDLVADQIHLGDHARYNRQAIRRLQNDAKPYLNIEYGYEEGVEPLHTYRSATTRSWQIVLDWTWALVCAGAYPCYYYSNTAWDLIKFDPEPPGWARYADLQRFVAGLPLNRMAADNSMVETGYCLTKPGCAILVFVPAGGQLVIDLGPDQSGDWKARWLQVHTGDTAEAEIRPQGFLTRIDPPFATPDASYALSLTRFDKAGWQ